MVEHKQQSACGQQQQQADADDSSGSLAAGSGGRGSGLKDIEELGRGLAAVTTS